MAPRESKVQRTIKDMPKASPIGKKTNAMKKTVEKTPVKVTKPIPTRQRTRTVPAVATPKPKENKSVPAPASVTQTAKKISSWKKRPKSAHSGVPIPEKMKKLMEMEKSKFVI